MTKLVFASVALFAVFLTPGVHGDCHSTCTPECKLHADCTEIFESGQTKSGVYRIQPVTYPESFYVYCDMDTDGGGWTVFQRREDGSVGFYHFYRDWVDYQQGFGNVNSEHWFGNERLFHFTAQASYALRVDLEDFEGQSRYAAYDHFRIGDGANLYKLIIGSYSGTAGDSLTGHNGAPFSTRDADHDSSDSNCASSYKGAWWYTACHASNLNGLYLSGSHESYADGVNWHAWQGHHYSYKYAEMKLRRQ